MKVRRIIANIHTQQGEQAARFYGEVLQLHEVMNEGWIRMYGFPEAIGQITVVSEGGSGAPPPHVSIEVDDLEEALARVTASGAKIIHGPQDEPWGVRRFLTIDPFGNVVNILSRPD